jgi:hypothetical protein
MDKFVWFSILSSKEHEFFNQYRSPKSEASVFKQIPIGYLDTVKSVLKRTGGAFRIVYRGPRGRYHDQAMTWKQDARAFTVYPR